MQGNRVGGRAGAYLDPHSELAEHLDLVLRNELSEGDEEAGLECGLSLNRRAIAFKQDQRQ